METKARYTLIGAFTLAVIALGFAFVYWLHAGSGAGGRMSYAIRYDGQVAGLTKGSSVLFNGVRVGEVTSLSLDPALPENVMVSISVDRQTPLRADTRVGIDFQGLTGSPVVALNGGSASQPLLNRDPSRPPPILVSEKNAGQGTMQAARDTLRSIDKVVGDNAEPLKSTIANIDKFSGALARNSDKVDTLVSGLERFVGGAAKGPARVYDIAAARTFPAGLKMPQSQLSVSEVTTLGQFDNDKIVVRGAAAAKPSIEGAQWPDVLPKVVQTRLIQSFESAGYTSVVGRGPDNFKSDFQLAVDIRAFDIATDTNAAEVELAAKIFNADGKLVGTRAFKASAPVAAVDAATATKALSGAFEKIAGDIVVWALGQI